MTLEHSITGLMIMDNMENKFTKIKKQEILSKAEDVINGEITTNQGVIKKKYIDENNRMIYVSENDKGEQIIDFAFNFKGKKIDRNITIQNIQRDFKKLKAKKEGKL